MILQDNYSLEHINELKKKSGKDPSLIERVLFAFGILESLRKVNMPFIFKGGTSLMLLLKEPKRLSTDIDILVKPDTDVDAYLEKAARIFPFDRKEEQTRKGNNTITKRHFKFYYTSPRTAKPFYILLDIVFEESPYASLSKKEITNPLLLTEGENLFVDTPTINCMLGDKLCTFAPNTTGIPYGIDKDMEIIKQMFDVSCLIDEFDNQNEVADVYIKSVKAESEFRGNSFTIQDCLSDTIRTCLCICSRGKTDTKNYPALIYGIRGVGTHIYGSRYTDEIAAQDACKILYFATCLYTNHPFTKITDTQAYLNIKSLPAPYRLAMYMKRSNPIAFGYLVEAAQLTESVKLPISA